MRSCENAHKEFDRQANGKIEIGSLPRWTNVDGRVVWYVFQGPYKSLPEAWSGFMGKARALSKVKFSGPPGDVYVCNPEEHKGEENSMITFLWVPIETGTMQKKNNA